MSNHNELNYERGYQAGGAATADFYFKKIEKMKHDIMQELDAETIELYDVAAEPIKAVPREKINKIINRILK